MPDLAGETYGVRGVSNSPDGAGVRADNNNGSSADLVLGGTPVAEVTEAAFSRDSTSPLTFNFTNPGTGTMTLRVDGVDVATGATIFPTVLANDGSGSTLDADLLDGLNSTAFLGSAVDDWVNETGDAMTGLLTIDPSSGFALQTGSGDGIDLGGDLFKSGTRFLHNPGTGNTGLGADALPGVAAESNTLRLGTSGTGVGHQNRAFIAAIRGTTTGVANAIAVLIDSAGQLGTISSSRRFKQDIEGLEEDSERVLELRPVRFRYKDHAAQGDTTPQYGLIAEEVAEVFPELVVYDAEGRPETVRYHLLAPLLLSEVQRLHREMGDSDRQRREEMALLTAQQEEIRALRRWIEQAGATLPRRGGP